MALVKLNNHPVNAFLDGFLNDLPAFSGKTFYPQAPVNISETPEAYILELNVPGRSKEDFKLSVDNDQLTISYEKKEENKEENSKYIRREFTYNSFKRTFSLDENVDVENILAKYENGLLNIRLPKKAAVKPSVKQIAVQ